MSQLVPDDQEVLTVPAGTRVEQALKLMRLHNFDQLPVTATENRVIGTFTYRSLARGMPHIRRDNPLSTPVDDLVEELQFVRPSQDVSTLLPHLEADQAVLVGDEDRLLAIVTATDISKFLWSRTRPFVLLQDIELGIRHLMRISCTATELADSLAAGLPTESLKAGARLEDLTLSELLSVLLHQSNFGRFFRRCFGSQRDLVRTMLDPVRDTRNKVFHFRDEVTEDELQKLDDVITWLRRRVLIRGGTQ
ncbi:CBS domain-containing protein [Microbispora bryophytorum]|uniref:CBS domain-containing protein n=1 Tax=Microbispora bryophytorum TaxID=1460882 RepID=UPI0033F86105